jgi:hypothetical protein
MKTFMCAKRRLDKLSVADAETGCINFTGSRDNCGYGRLSYKGRARLSHRVAFEEYVSPIPDGMQVLHKCDNPSCVNPSHLFLGTVDDNMADMKAKGRGRGPRGTGCHLTKLRPDQAYAIRWRALSGGEKHKHIAADFGVTRKNVGAIGRFETWQFEAHD